MAELPPEVAQNRGPKIEHIPHVAEGFSANSEGLRTAKTAGETSIVERHEVGPDGQTQYLRTHDGREFLKLKDGVHLVTAENLVPVVVNNLSVANGMVSYIIGKLMAVEGNGRRFVSNLNTGETDEFSSQSKQAITVERTPAELKSCITSGTQAERAKALPELVAVVAGAPDAAGCTHVSAAAEALLELCAAEQHGAKPVAAEAIDSLLTAYKDSSAARRPSGAALDTIIRIASGMNAIEINPDVYPTVAQAVKDTAKHPQSEEFAKATDAMLQMAMHWGADDARFFVQHITADTATKLAQVATRTAPGVKETIKSEIEQQLKDPKMDAATRQAADRVLLSLQDGYIVDRQGRSLRRDFPFDQLQDISATWDDVWKRTLHEELPRAYSEQDEKHPSHEYWSRLCHKYLAGQDAGALDKLRELSYLTSSGYQYSVIDYYSKLAFVDSAQRYEAGKRDGDSAQAREALTDMIVLDRSHFCCDGVHRRIEEYLRNEKQSGRLSERELTAVYQQVQRRDQAGLNDAAEAFVQLLQPGNQPDQIEELAQRFAAAVSDTDLPDSTCARIRQFGESLKIDALAKELNEASLANPHVRGEVVNSINQLYQRSSGDPQAKETLRQAGLLGDYGALQMPDSDEQLCQAFKSVAQSEYIGSNLRDVAALRMVPLTPRDILEGDLLGRDFPGAADTLRDYASLKALRETLKRSGDDGKGFDGTQLQRLTDAIKMLSGSSNNQLLNEFGGAATLGQALAGLHDPAKRRATFEMLRQGIESSAAQKVVGRVELVGANPGAIAQLDGADRCEQRQSDSTSRSNYGRDLLTRDEVTQAEIQSAIDSAKERGTKIDSDFNALEEKFLARPEPGEDAGKRRQDSLAAIERFGLAQFGRGGDDQRLSRIPDYRAVEQLTAVDAAKSPAEKLAALNGLIELSDGGNSLAHQFVDALSKGTSSHAKSIFQLRDQLQRGTDAEKSQSMLVLAARSPGGEAQLNLLRVGAITRDITACVEPTVGHFDKVAQALAMEDKAGNKAAAEWMRWTEANQAVARLSAHGGGPATAEDRTAAVKDLSRMAEHENNPYARSALVSMLTAGDEAPVGMSHEGREPKRPDLNHLSADERQSMLRTAAETVDRLTTNNELDETEARSLCVALGRAAQAKDVQLENRLTAILDRNCTDKVMEGFTAAILRTPPPAGSEAIADAYLRHTAHPAFAQHFDDFVYAGTNGNQNAMYVIGGTLGATEIPAKVFNRARNVADFLSGDPQTAAAFAGCLMDRFRSAGDRNSLLETLGKTVGNPCAKLSESVAVAAQTMMRQAANDAFNADGTIDGASAATYRSAIEGMGSIASRWQAPDIDTLTRRFTPAVERALAAGCDSIPRQWRQELIDRSLAHATADGSSSDERVSALAAAGALARYATAKDVALLQQVSQQNNHDVSAQIAASRALLQIVSCSECSQPVRDLATDGFIKSGWAQTLGPEVAHALSDYANGKNVNPELLARVTEVAYDAGVKPPVVQLLRSLGIDNVPPAELKTAIERVGGDAKFGNMLTQIQAYEALPKSLQEIVKNGGGDFSHLSPADLDPTKDGKPERINLRAVLQHLQKDGLTGSYQFLSGDRITDSLDSLKTAVLTEIGQRAKIANPAIVDEGLRRNRCSMYSQTSSLIQDRPSGDLKAARTKTLEELCRVTREGDGTSKWLLALGVGTYMRERNINVAKFEASQSKLVGTLEKQSAAIDAQMGTMRRLQAVAESCDLAAKAQTAFRLGADGDRLGADAALISMANEYGTASMQMYAPGSWGALTGYGTERWQQGAWGRMQLNGLALTGDIPQYDIGKPEAVGEALYTLAGDQLLAPSGEGADPRLDRRRFNDVRLSGREMLVHDALRALDSAPATVQAVQASSEIISNFDELNRLVQAGIGGRRGADMVRHARDLVSSGSPPDEKGLEPAINHIQQCLPQLAKTVEEMRQARANCQDELACRALDQRIESLSSLVKTFSPGSPQMDQFKEMCRLVRSGSMDETTWWRTLRDTAVPIAIGVVVCAGVVATCGTGTPLAVIGGAALMSTLGLAAHEAYSEISYRNNWNGTGGALLGDAYRRAQHEKGERDSGFLVWDAQQGAFQLGPTYQEAWQSHFTEVGLGTAQNLILMGYGKCVSGALRWATTNPSEAAVLNRLIAESGRRAAALESVSAGAATRAWCGRFLVECRNQVGFSIAQDATHDAIKHGFHTQDFSTEMLSALICITATHTMGHFQELGIRPRFINENTIQIPAQQEAFLQQMRSRFETTESGKNIRFATTDAAKPTVTIDGKVFNLRFIAPEQAIAVAKEQRRSLAEGRHGGAESQPVQVVERSALTGRPAGVSERVAQAPGGQKGTADTKYKLCERAPQARQQMDGFVELANAGDYAGATEYARNCAAQMEQAGQATVRYIPVDINVAELNSPSSRHQQSMSGTAGDAARATGTTKHVDIVMAQPRLTLSDGRTVVDLTNLSQARTSLTGPQQTELDQALSTSGGKALLRRMGLQHMEEVIVHGNQILGGGRVSFVQAQFDQAVAKPEGGVRHGAALAEWQSRGPAPHQDQTSALAAEQEVLSLPFERGLNFSDLNEVAANAEHAGARSNMHEYIGDLHRVAGTSEPSGKAGAGKVSTTGPNGEPAAEEGSTTTTTKSNGKPTTEHASAATESAPHGEPVPKPTPEKAQENAALMEAVAGDKDAEAIRIAHLRGALDVNTAKRLLSEAANADRVDGSRKIDRRAQAGITQHVEDMRAIIREQASGNAREKMKPSELAALMADPQKAFETSLNVPKEFHSDPELFEAQKKAFACVQELMKHVQDPIEDLQAFVREDLRRMYSDSKALLRLGRKYDKPDFDASMRELEWLSAAITKSPEDANLLDIAEAYPHTALNVQAAMAGALEKLPHGRFVVLVHGAGSEYCRQLVAENGAGLANDHSPAKTAAEGGRKGDFYASQRIRVGRAYAAQSEIKDGGAVMGIALPEVVYKEMIRTKRLEEGVMINIDDANQLSLQVGTDRPPESQQLGPEVTFRAEALDELKAKGFFFMIEDNGAAQK